MKRRIRKALIWVLVCYVLLWCAPHIPRFLFGLTALPHLGDIWHAKIDVGPSERFSPLEIRLAMNSAFSEVFVHGGTLERVWYDEARCNAEFGDIDTDHIKIYCDFVTNEHLAYAGWESGQKHRGWSLLLYRWNRLTPWFVSSSGYA